ncbi:TetR family transcriptional regulator [Klebsiella pneumoniae]|nr:TetR family transcriptional regulator [Klebsiella pneumoniae]
MQAAMRLALRGGFAAMTVRQIAREAQVAAGQLHHHFTSIGELKAQVFIRLIREMLDMPLVAEDASWRERLFSMIAARMADWNPISACGAKARCWPTAIRTSKRPTC